MQWANPCALILNIEGTLDRPSLINHSGAKCKIFTVTFLIFNRIIFRFDGFQLHHPPVIPAIRRLIFMHYSLFNHYVKLYHCHRHFLLNGFFCFFCSNVFQSCTPECTNSLAFFPVTVRLVIIIIWVLHTSCDEVHKHERRSRSTCTTTHNCISITRQRRKCCDPRRHCWWHAMENNKQYYYTTIHRRDGTHFTT